MNYNSANKERVIDIYIYQQPQTNDPGQSIQSVDPTGKHRIRHRIAPETSVFPRKTGRIRTGFSPNLCGRITIRITSEKIRSVPVEYDYRILSEPPDSSTWKKPDNTRFYTRSGRISSESGTRILDRIISERSRSNLLKSTHRIMPDTLYTIHI